ncbi:MAG: mannose-1-phosphate guanylyltransferase [Syntrophorhabdaceae bacterium]
MVEPKRRKLPVQNNPTRTPPGKFDDTYFVIMAGGQGERFWPMSTKLTAKPFIPLTGEKALIHLTIERAQKIVPPDRIFFVLEKIYLPVARECLPEIPRENFIVEAVGRDTAPCIGLAASTLRSKDPRAVIVFLPSDHYVPDEKHFANLVRKAVVTARHRDDIITIGVRPLWPETGYGYIKTGKAIPSSGNEYFTVARYVEKPSLEKARRYTRHGAYYWNTGIFITRANVLCDSLHRHMPELYAGLMEIQNALKDGKRAKADQIFTNLEEISIDYGLMEKAKNVIMAPATFSWDDIGTWTSLLRVLDRDEKGNVIRGNVLAIDTENSVVISGKTPVAVLGLSDVVVVSSRTGILVCDASRAQDVRKIAKILSRKETTEKEK